MQPSSPWRQGVNYVTDFIAIYSKVKGCVDKDRPVDVVSMGFSKAFDCLSQFYCVQVTTLWLSRKFKDRKMTGGLDWGDGI